MANTSVTDMTKGNTLGLILSFSIPVLFGNLFQQFYSMADAVIVGRFLGEDALAAVGSTGSLMFLVLGFAIGIAQGFGIMVSQAFGAKDYKLLRHYVALSILIGFIVSVITTIVTMAGSKHMLLWMQTPENIFSMAHEYILIIFAGIIATMFYNIASSILRGVGDSRTPLYFLIFSSILNILLDLLFILVFKTGPEGAAYATVIAQAIAALFSFLYMFYRFEILRTKKSDYYFDPRSTRNLLFVALPMALNYSITAIGTMVLQTAVNTFGSSVVAAFTAAVKVEALATQTMPTLGTAMATFCGQNLGAGKYDRIFDGMKKAFWIGIASVLAAIFITLFFGESIIGMFLTNPSTEVLTYAKQYLLTVSVFYFWLCMIYLYRTALQGLGLSLMPMLAGVFELIFRFVTVIFLVAPFGFWSVRLASPAAWFGAGLPMMITYYLWKKKIKNTVLINKTVPSSTE